MNKMIDLINKIERRLGTTIWNLPKEISKETWAEAVIATDTLPTFSRFFPNKILYNVNTKLIDRNGFFFIDDSICKDNIEILGIRDINWEKFGRSAQGTPHMNNGILDGTYTMEDISMTQMRMDHSSFFNLGYYITFEPPNKIKVNAPNNSHMSISSMNHTIPIDLFVMHKTNLMTISPTKMELFERLAIADVASFLYEQLKHYDNLETPAATLDLKLGTLEDKKNDRAEVIQIFTDGYVSAANDNQPFIFCI